MSLRVWLPLTGDFHNQGLDNPSLTTPTGYTFISEGKIGSCLKTSASSMLDLGYNGDQINTGSLSFGGWFKFNFNEINTIVSAKTYDSTHPYATGSLIGNNNYGGIGLQWRSNNMDNGESFSTMLLFTSVRTTTNGSRNSGYYQIPFDTWLHIFLIFDKDNKKCSLYINGVQEQTFATLDFSDARSFNLYLNYWGIYGGNGPGLGIPFSCNDLRIYDHALSEKEIKEISKGLILNYSLDRNFVYINLMPNSLNMPLGTANPSTGTWRLAGINSMTRSRVAISDTPDGDGYGFQNSGTQTITTDASCYGIDNFPLAANTTYKISMWARMLEGSDAFAGFEVYNKTILDGSHIKYAQNYYLTPLLENGDWTYCWMTIQTNSATTRNIYIGITTGQTAVTTQMCNVSIEEINNLNFIYDCSGYHNDGTLTGNLSYSSSSPRHSYSSYFKDYTNYIQRNMGSIVPDSITMSCWIKGTNKSARGNHHIPLNMHDTNFEISIATPGGQARMGYVIGGTRYVANIGPDILDGQWHMLTSTFDGTTIRRYVDGTLIHSQEHAGALTSLSTLGVGNFPGGTTYGNTQLYESDVRVYITALSSKDILELYHTGESIDKAGNLYAYEFYEDDNASISTGKNGVVTAKEYDNQENLTSFYKTGQIYTNELKEI